MNVESGLQCRDHRRSLHCDIRIICDGHLEFGLLAVQHPGLSPSFLRQQRFAVNLPTGRGLAISVDSLPRSCFKYDSEICRLQICQICWCKFFERLNSQKRKRGSFTGFFFPMLSAGRVVCGWGGRITHIYICTPAPKGKRKLQLRNTAYTKYSS
jgi:hypothetical protein